MGNKDKIIGYSRDRINSDNSLSLPKFSKSTPGERLIIIPEDDKLAIYSSKILENYIEKIDKLKLNDRVKYLNKFKNLCGNAIQEVIVDNKNKIKLDLSIDFNHNEDIEILGSGDRILVSGEFKLPKLYSKRV